jgi:SAM-dependent methyltransferase
VGVYARFHERWVHGRRVRVLSDALAALLPRDARVLDVGCGDGFIDKLVMERRPDLEISGIDVVMRRSETHIPVEPFDGTTIPYDDGSMDVVMLVDVLHHTETPVDLLREALRVSRDGLVLKDVTTGDPDRLAKATLTGMDWVGNARHDVPLPYNFFTREQWRAAFDELGVVESERRERFGLYPWPATLLFERRMHFACRLRPAGAAVGRS